MLYRIQEGTLALDEDWWERGTNILVPGNVDIAHPNIVVTRDRLEEGATLADMVARQRVTLEKGLPGFQLVSETDIDLDGHSARLLECTWERPPGGRVYQAAICVLHGERRVLILGVSLPPELAIPQMRDQMLARLMSFKFAESPGDQDAARPL